MDRMSRIIIEMHQRPTRLAIIVIITVMLPIWWMTGDFSPLP